MSRIFEVKFDTGNAAFSDGCLEIEIARVLRSIASRVEDVGCTGCYETILDVNGNDVGRFKLGRS